MDPLGYKEVVVTTHPLLLRIHALLLQTHPLICDGLLVL